MILGLATAECVSNQNHVKNISKQSWILWKILNKADHFQLFITAIHCLQYACCICVFSFCNNRSWRKCWFVVHLQTTSPSRFHSQSWVQFKNLTLLNAWIKIKIKIKIHTHKLTKRQQCFCSCSWEANEAVVWLFPSWVVPPLLNGCSRGNTRHPKVTKIKYLLGSIPWSKPKWELTVPKNLQKWMWHTPSLKKWTANCNQNWKRKQMLI